MGEAQQLQKEAERRRQSLSEELQQLELDHFDRGTKLQAAELRACDLEGSVRIAEARGASSEEETSRCSAQLTISIGKVADMERELTALRAAAKLEAERVQHSTRLAEEQR